MKACLSQFAGSEIKWLASDLLWPRVLRSQNTAGKIWDRRLRQERVHDRDFTLKSDSALTNLKPVSSQVVTCRPSSAPNLLSAIANLSFVNMLSLILFPFTLQNFPHSEIHTQKYTHRPPLVQRCSGSHSRDSHLFPFIHLWLEHN